MEWFETNKRCRDCKAWMVAAPVRAEPGMWRKSAMVIICPLCDQTAHPHSRAMWINFNRGKL